MSSKVSLAMRLSSPIHQKGNWDSKRTAINDEASKNALSSTRTPSPSPERKGTIRASATPSPSLLSRLQGPVHRVVPPSPMRLLDRIQKPEQDMVDHVAHTTPLAQRLGLTLDESRGRNPPDSELPSPEDHSEPLQTNKDPITHTDQPRGELTGPCPSAGHNDISSTTLITAHTHRPSIQILDNAMDDANVNLPGSSVASPDSETSISRLLYFTSSPAEIDEVQCDRGSSVVPTDMNDVSLTPRVNPVLHFDERSKTPPNDSMNAPQNASVPDVHVIIMECPEVPTIAEAQNPPTDAVIFSAPGPIAPNEVLDPTPSLSVIETPIASADGNNRSGSMPVDNATMNAHPITPAAQLTTEASIEHFDASASDIVDMVMETPIIEAKDTLQPASPDVLHIPISLPDEFTNALDVSLSLLSEPAPLPAISQTTSSSPAISSSRDVPLIEIEQCRAALIPVILHNANQRSGLPYRSPTAEDVQAPLMDERCLELIAKAKQVSGHLASRSQDGAKPSAPPDIGTSNKPSNKPNDTTTKVQMHTEPSPPSRPLQEPAPPPTSTVPTSPKSQVAKPKWHPTFVSDDPSLLIATPMRERRDSYGRDQRSQYSPQSSAIDYGDATWRRRLSYPMSPPPPAPQRNRSEANISCNIDPVAYESNYRGTKRPRRTSVDDVHSTPLQPPHSTLKSSPQSSPVESVQLQVATVTSNASPSVATPAASRDRSDGPQRPVPGLWLAKVGLPEPDIIDVTLDINSDMLDNPGGPVTNPVVLHLICLSTQTVSETYATLDDSATSEDIANAMWSIKTSWPLGGKLVINVNHEQGWGRSLLPLDLIRPGSGPAIDVTRYLRPGKNRLRFIHLDDLSAYTFVLHASRTPPSRATMKVTAQGFAKIDEYVARVKMAKMASEERASIFNFGPG